MIDAIDITANQRKTLLEMLKRHLPDTAVWVYGSRVKWTSRPESDMDMVVFASPDQKRQVSDLKEALEETDLPFRVDIFKWDEVPEGFRKNIEAEHVVLQEQSEKSLGMGSDIYPMLPLGELLEVFDSKRIPVKRGDRKPGPYPYYGASGIADWVDSYIFEGPHLLLAEDGENLKTKSTPIAFMADGKFWVNNHAHILKGDSELETKFFCYALLAADVDTYLSGSTRPKLTQGDMKRIPLFSPPPEIRRAIAHTLGSLDDKIELNRQMNRTLEKMAQAIFKSWFIDFDPVRAKAEGRDTGLPKNITDLFPDSFEDSNLGKIPKGWTLKGVSSLLDINPRLVLSKGRVARYVDMKALPTSGFSVTDVIEKEFKGGAKFQQHDILLARITPCLENGKTGLVDFLDEGQVGFGSTEFIVLRGKNGITKEFVYCLARNDQFRRHCISSMVGSSGRQRVQNACFDHYFLAGSSESILTALRERVRPSFEKIIENSRESIILSKLRDTLLPKLISGELPIPDAEKLLDGLNINGGHNG